MKTYVTLVRAYLLLVLVLAQACFFGPKLAADTPKWLAGFYVAVGLSLLALIVLCMVRLSVALIRRRLSYDEHGSALAVVLSTLALLILVSLALGPIC